MRAGYFIQAFAISVCCAFEMAANATFYYALTGHFPTTLYGVAFVVDGAAAASVSVALAVFQTLAASEAVRAKTFARRAQAVAFMAVCLVCSGAAMVSHVQKVQRQQQQHDLAGGDGYRLGAEAERAAKGAYDRLVADLDAVATRRTTEEIQAAMKATKISSKAFRLSKQCNRIGSSKWYKRECAPILKLRVELAAAIQRADLTTRSQQAKAKWDAARGTLRGMKPPVERSEGERFAATWLPWTFAGAVLAVATFGFAFLNGASPAPVVRSKVAEAQSTEVAAGDVLAAVEGIRAGRIRSSVAELQGQHVFISFEGLGSIIGRSKTTARTRVKKLVATGKLEMIKENGRIGLRIIYPHLSASNAA